jgi:tetratricopeptide (TPR) repeat protein
MKEITPSQLDPRLQKQIENARKAVKQNPSYATDILASIVARNIACLEVRQLLRQAQLALAPAKPSALRQLLNKVTRMPAAIGMAAKVAKNPRQALLAAEELLARDVSNPVGHRMLGLAATALGMSATANFAYAGLLHVEPQDSENAKLLMRLYLESGQNQAALKVGDDACRVHPSDRELQNLIKQAAVEQSINKGKWEADESFRDKLKDEAQSQQLEQAGRAKTGESGLREIIAAGLKAVAAEPENINYYRDLVSNYRKLGELDQALQWLGQARQMDSGKADVSLERLEVSLKREVMAQSIQAKQQALADDPHSEVLQAELEDLCAKERSFHLEQTQDLVQRYPNEFSYRYELGQLYFAAGEVDEAIKQLQLAQRSPKVRVDALILLGKTYMRKGFADLAIEQFNTVKSEITGMNDLKKDILYQLGSAYQQQGKSEQAIAEFKLLYAADIGFRDVADKIDAFYAAKNS